ncbi:phosphate ABC transporter substrate-binding/OmpA family protein [Ruegeria sp. 2012CJ41-6]|uniref:Phosphate ABC transporter substrate-binding/OmpA family protein n=1 Tax=Ruegeria spongiae TaxID=2942209 RepID=A0ABT0Q5N7_9RHOB|nr:phosphate ABC transporter substrate-binding/OmpA family protein [Ruegeria spongiae]MCL6285186.1 phosphate ABC transporter substrate-binding/OmpA family protein [Ruegeria spongiae]
MNWLRAAVFAALFVYGTALPGLAQDVTLTSRDGAVAITGDLLGFDGEFYRVDTSFGELTVDASGVSCDGPACPKLTDFVAEITLAGSSSMAEVLLPALLEGFARRNGYLTQRLPLPDGGFVYALQQPGQTLPAARFRFDISSTDQGIDALLNGRADIAMALREIRPEERDRAREAGLGDMTHPNRSRVLSLDAMVPIVAPDNPVHSLSVDDLARVLSGAVTSWAELGGPDAPIAVHLPGGGSGLGQAVEDRILKPGGTTALADATRHQRGSNLTRAVEADPFALGIASFAEIGNARPLTLTGTCGYAIAANRRSIKTEDYPLNSPMFLYIPARRLPKVAREFLAYTRGPSAQLVIRKAGFVDQMPELVEMGSQGARLANAIASAGDEVPLSELQRLTKTLSPLARLTTSFRFEAGSSRPDAQSRANIQQLAQALEVGTYDARKLVFVGFSDGVGPATSNQSIALRRAKAVRKAVIEAAETAGLDRVEISVEAFGEAMPMACDDSDWGRQVNRRVEVWTR